MKKLLIFSCLFFLIACQNSNTSINEENISKSSYVDNDWIWDRKEEGIYTQEVLVRESIPVIPEGIFNILEEKGVYKAYVAVENSKQVLYINNDGDIRSIYKIEDNSWHHLYIEEFITIWDTDLLIFGEKSDELGLDKWMVYFDIKKNKILLDGWNYIFLTDKNIWYSCYVYTMPLVKYELKIISLLDFKDIFTQRDIVWWCNYEESTNQITYTIQDEEWSIEQYDSYDINIISN